MNSKLSSIVFLACLCIAGSPVTHAQTTESASIALCNEAVLLGKGYIEAMRNIDHQRHEAGAVSAAEHAGTLALLTAQSQNLVVSLCMNSEGARLNFYHCLVTHSGKVPACLNS